MTLPNLRPKATDQPTEARAGEPGLPDAKWNQPLGEKMSREPEIWKNEKLAPKEIWFETGFFFFLRRVLLSKFFFLKKKNELEPGFVSRVFFLRMSDTKNLEG